MKDGRVFQKVIGKIDSVKDACKEQKIGPARQIARADTPVDRGRRPAPRAAVLTIRSRPSVILGVDVASICSAGWPPGWCCSSCPSGCPSPWA